MRSVRLAAASLLIVVFGVGAWAAVYAYDKGFSKKWRRLIMEEFERRGIEAEIGKLTIDPVDGLVARDVKIFAGPAHHSVVASINNITLDIDLAKMLRKQQFLNTVEFRDADISFPIDPTKPDSERLEIKDFSARVHLPENKIEIERAECNFHGVRVSLVGSLLQPKPSPDKRRDKSRQREQVELMKERRAVFARIVEELEKFDFREAPHLHLEVIGDLDDPSSIEATAHLTGREVGRGPYLCDTLEVRAEYQHPELLIDQLRITDQYGELYADAHWRAGERSVPFNIESSIDSYTLLGSLFGTTAPGEVVFYSPPKLGAKGEIKLGTAEEPGTKLRLVGSFECDRFSSRGGQIFEGAYADFSIRDESWYVRNLLIEHRSGTAGGSAKYEPDEGVIYNVAVEMDPTTFLPFLEKEQTQKFLDRFKFGRNPTISLRFSGSGPELDQHTWTTKGDFTIGPCFYRDVPVVGADGKFQIESTDMTFTDFRIRREEGLVDGEFVRIRSAEKLVEIRNVRSRAFPDQVAAYFAPRTAEVLSRYRFLKPPEVTLNGTVDSVRGGGRSQLLAEFSTDGPASFELFGRQLPVSAPAGTVKVEGHDLELELATSALGGRAEFAGNFGLGERKGNITGNLKVQGVEFAQYTDLYEIPTETEGTLDGELHFAIPAADPKRWSGTGSARLVDGDVFAVPVLGPISRLISNVMDKPTAGYSVANEANATFTIARGVIRSDDLVALTPGFSLSAKGMIDTVADQIDIDAEMNARGPLRLVGWPLSKLLKYKGEGSVAEPSWRAVNFTLPRRGDDGERPRVIEAVPRAVGAGTKATVGLGGKALGTGVKVIGAGTRGAVELGSKARDLIPIPRLIPKREERSEEDGEEDEVEVELPRSAGRRTN